jgi:ribonuclease VapC
MIVDTSALVAIMRREAGADRMLDRLLAATGIRISAGTLIETRIVAEREGGAKVLTQLLDELGAEIVPVDAKQADLAFEGFRRFGKGRHPAGLNFGDLFAYALARSVGEPLLFKGADFGKTDVAAVT